MGKDTADRIAEHYEAIVKVWAAIDELVAVLTEVSDGIDHDTDCPGDLGPAPCKCIVFRVGYALAKARRQ